MESCLHEQAQIVASVVCRVGRQEFQSWITTVPLKCNVALARQYFPQVSILDPLLSTSTHTNSTRVKRGVKADVEDSIGLTRLLEGVFALSLE